MVVAAGLWSSEKAEMNNLEINKKSHPQLVENKQEFRNLQQKFLVTQVAYFLAKGQNNYEYEDCKDLIKSMLRDERLFMEKEFAEQLRQYEVLVFSRERELTQLSVKLREGRDASCSLIRHLQALLTPDELDESQGWDLREQLAEGCRLAQDLLQKLSPATAEDEDEDVKVEEAEKVEELCAPREVQKAEEQEVPEDSLEECAVTCSNSHGPCESNQPHGNTEITFEEDQVDPPLVVDSASSGDERQDAPNLLPVPGPTSSATNISMVVSAGPWSREKAEMNILEINKKSRPQLVENKQEFRNLQQKFLVTQVAYFLANGQNNYEYEDCKDLIKSMLRDERLFVEKELAEQFRQYEGLVFSRERELTQLSVKLREGRDAARSLIGHLQALLTPDEPDESQGWDLREQLAEGCRLAQDLLQKLSPANDQEEDEDVKVEEAEKVEELCAPREVQKAEEQEVPEDSLEEYAVTCSNSHGPCESNQPHGNTKVTFEEDQVDPPLVVDSASSGDERQDAPNLLPESEDCKDLMKSTLRDERLFMEEELSEQLRQYEGLVFSRERELTQLSVKLREGRDAARSLIGHLQALLTPDEPDESQGWDLREQLAEGCRLAQDLLQKLSPANDEDKDEDVKVEEAEKVEEFCAPREVQKAEEKEVPEDSLEECAVTCSNSHGPCESKQPHGNKITFQEDPVDSTLTDSSSHDEWLDAVHIIPENESDHEEEEEKGPVSPRNLQESEEEEAPQESWDEGDSTLSIPPDMSASYQSDRSTFHSVEEQQVGLALDIGRHWCDQVKKEDQEATGPRLSRELLDEKESEVLQDSRDRFYSSPFADLELLELCNPYRSAVNSSEEEHLGLALDVDRIKKDQEEEEDQGPPCPRLSRELLEVVETEDLQDSLDRCYSTPSSYLEQPDSWQPYSLEEEYIGLSVDVDEIEKYQEGEEDQNPPCPRLNGVLMEAEEPEVLQNSVDRRYSTPSTYFELDASFQHYRSDFYSFEEEHVSLALDVDNRFFTLTGMRHHLVFQVGGIFPH
ncbi:neuroblastoma breakpoint family member 1-like isoform X1 [Symphalangus syndactylus]|uniref:neuroblastoma breakpoint family member 1-like isoform X1 n=2 Tax=Symphalangus syndactylus TaxID=9590 RepID=UPI003007E7A8